MACQPDATTMEGDLIAIPSLINIFVIQCLLDVHMVMMMSGL